MKIKFKKLNEKAFTPVKAHETDAAFDIVATSGPEINFEKGIVTYHTGLAMEIPVGYCAKIYPRSSVYKYDLSLSNCVGVIDSGYRGEIMFKFKLTNKTFDDNIKLYNEGDAIGQLMIEKLVYVEFEETDELSSSERGEGGFGSTGIKRQ